MRNSIIHTVERLYMGVAGRLCRASLTVGTLLLIIFLLGGCVSGGGLGGILAPQEKDTSAERPSSAPAERDLLRSGTSSRPSETRDEVSAREMESSRTMPTQAIQTNQVDQPDSDVFSERSTQDINESDLSSERERGARPRLETREVYKVDEQFVDQRLDLYAKKLDQWNEAAGKIVQLEKGNTWPDGWHDCVQKIEMLIFGYRRVKAGLKEKDDHASGINSWGLLQNDINYIEGACEEILSDSQTGLSEDVSAYSIQVSDEAKALLKRYFDMGMYKDAVSMYEQQAEVDSQFSEDIDLRKLYAEALLRSGRINGALKILEELQQSNGPIVSEGVFADSLHYADVLFAAGQYERASQQYTQIKEQFAVLGEREQWLFDQAEILKDTDSALLDVYSNILRLYFTSDRTAVPDEIYKGYETIDRKSQSIMLVAVRKLLHELEQAVEAHSEKELAHAEELMHDGEFVEARKILTELGKSASDLIQEKSRMILEQVEEEERAQKLTLKQLQQQKIRSQWENALHLFEIKKYDAAIAEFTQLLNTEHQNEAEAKIAQAASFAATDMRRKAASLFVKARKASDPAQKISFLNESKTVLLDLLEKYPGTDIVGKVQQNLKVLEEELEKTSSLQPEQVPLQ